MLLIGISVRAPGPSTGVLESNNKIQISKRLFQSKSSRFVLPPLFSFGLLFMGPAASNDGPVESLYGQVAVRG